MNAFVKKEIRLLLPGFIMLIVLFFVCVFLSMENHVVRNAAVILCPAMAVYMALNSFGGEMSSGTFSMLLAQPISRRRIWRTKTLLLGTALFFGGILWSVFLYIGAAYSTEAKDVTELFVFGWLILLAIYSGSLWTVLLLRQVAAAFWFTILVPPILMCVVVALLQKYPDLQERAVIGLLIVYSIAGFIFARWLFFRAQDVQWSGGTIALPEMRGAASVFRRSSGKRFYRPKAALFWKEVQSHQSQFVVAAVLIVLHLAVLLERKFGNYARNSAQVFVLESFWAIWLVMPLLIGISTVAEERKLGTLASQLSLPVNRRTQFAIKLSVALLLSLLFGLGMPALLEASRVPALFHDGWPMLAFIGIVLAIASIAFYASSLANNTLQALGLAILGVLVFATLLVSALRPEALFHYPLWRGFLIYLVGIPMCGFVLLRLAFWNFQRIDLGGKVMGRNILVLIASLVFAITTTTAVYHRVWKKLTPFEAAHGAARLSLLHPVILSAESQTLLVRLPDGQTWGEDFRLNMQSASRIPLFLDPFRVITYGGSFFAGSNWANISAYGFLREKAGVKTDGTLWVSQKLMHHFSPAAIGNYGWVDGESDRLEQLGTETDWKSVLPHGYYLLLIKKDGTLWTWGAMNGKFDHKNWPGLPSFTPRRVGTDSDWSAIFEANYQTYFRKTGGVLYAWLAHRIAAKSNTEYWGGPEPTKEPVPEHTRWNGAMIRGYQGDYWVGVTKDGTLRLWGPEASNRGGQIPLMTTDFQIGQTAHWLAAIAGDEERKKVVTLKEDGTLWLWKFPSNDNWRDYPSLNEKAIEDMKPVQMGTHSDWIAAAAAPGGVMSVAADGSVWYWPLESAEAIRGYRNENDPSYLQPLLDVPHKPQRVANIFEQH
jgi:hypothetical protein